MTERVIGYNIAIGAQAGGKSLTPPPDSEEVARLKISIASRDELLGLQKREIRPSPEALSIEEKLIWQLGNMMDATENFYGAPNPKREGHIYSTAIRILDEIIDPLRGTPAEQTNCDNGE